MRIVFSLFVSLVIFVSGVVYILSQPMIYEAKGMLEKLDEPELSQPTLEDTIMLLINGELAEGVAQRLSVEERNRLLAPDAGRQRLSIEELDAGEYLSESKRMGFSILHETRMIEVSFRHEDPGVTTTVVNNYMKEVVDYFLKLGIGATMRQVEADRIHYDETLKLIPQLEEEIVSLESKKVNHQEILDQLSELRKKLAEASDIRDELKKTVITETVRWSLKKPHVRIIKEAELSSQPVSPNVPLGFICSFFCGLLCGVISFLLLGRIRKNAA